MFIVYRVSCNFILPWFNKIENPMLARIFTSHERNPGRPCNRRYRRMEFCFQPSGTHPHQVWEIAILHVWFKHIKSCTIEPDYYHFFFFIVQYNSPFTPNLIFCHSQTFSQKTGYVETFFDPQPPADEKIEPHGQDENRSY